MVKVSIIIPTLNEENYLPKLLNSIKSQTFKDYEIIVSDANSTDNTRKIAKKFGCRIVDGRGSLARGRNKGAESARGELLLFIDADLIIQKDFLSRAVAEFEKRSLDLAAFYFTPINGTFADTLFLNCFNVFITAAQYCKPFGGGACLLAKKHLHTKIVFNEKISGYLEDIDYVHRSAKIGTVRVIKSPRVFMSMRRFEKEGRLHTISRYFSMYLYWLYGRELTPEKVKKTKLEYSFIYEK